MLICTEVNAAWRPDSCFLRCLYKSFHYMHLHNARPETNWRYWFKRRKCYMAVISCYNVSVILQLLKKSYVFSLENNQLQGGNLSSHWAASQNLVVDHFSIRAQTIYFFISYFITNIISVVYNCYHFNFHSRFCPSLLL